MDGHVRDVCAEATGGRHPGDELRGDRDGHLVDRVAAEADEVDVVGVPGQVEGGRAMVEVGVRDQTELLEGFERTVDGGRGQGAAPVGVDLRSNRIRGGVPEPRQRVDDAAPLRRQPHPVGAQHCCEVTHRSTVCRPAPG